MANTMLILNSQIFLQQNRFIVKKELILGHVVLWQNMPKSTKQGLGRDCCKQSPLKEHKSSKYSDFSLAGLWQSPSS